MMTRGVGLFCIGVLLAGCVGGKQGPPRLPHENPADDRAELSDQSCGPSSENGAAPFDSSAAEGVIRHAADRAASCGLHTLSHFDLTIQMSWGGSGCVAHVELQDELPSNLSECLLRRFSAATLRPFSGEAPAVQVRMTNDRVWWTWL